jgi:nucleotide-binding universal stress UspA family protein
MRGVEHVACLTSPFAASLDSITLLRVINLALFAERMKEGIDPYKEAKTILDKAREVFLKADIPEGVITNKVRIGTPSGEILREAEEGDNNLIVMGRKGRTALKDLILGGVSSTVLQRSQNPTVAIVSTR